VFVKNFRSVSFLRRMLPRDANLLLLALVAVSALSCIASDYTGKRILVYVFKPLTMVWVLALAGQAGTEIDPSYRGLVVTALLFSLAGDVLLMLPSDRFAQGLASFLVAHLVYVAAFWADGGGSGPPLALLPFVLAGATLFVVSDAALAANRFRTPFAAAQAVVLGTYFSGQCLIALSTGVGRDLLGGG